MELREIPIDNIIVPSRARLGRVPDTDLMYKIKKFGLLEPILVTPAVMGEDDFFLINGLKRILASIELGKETIMANIKPNVETVDIKLYEAICNNISPYTVWEKISLGKYIESKQKFFIIPEIDQLLGLRAGDYVVLKELDECSLDGVDEILEKLESGDINFKQAKKKLDKLKKEMEEPKEDKDVQELDLESEINELDVIPEPNKQTIGNRKVLPASLRKAVEDRDNFTCQSCGISGETYARIFEVHHIVPVYLGGLDDKNNLILLCPNCHKMVHCFGFGDLYIDPENKNRFKAIIRLGNIIAKKVKICGKPIDVLKKEHEEYTKYEGTQEDISNENTTDSGNKEVS